MPNKKITQLPICSVPTNTDIFPIVNSGNTKSLSIGNLADYISNNFQYRTTGGTYHDGIETLSDNQGGSITISGFTKIPKHWLSNETKELASDETLVISGNYVLSGTNLTLQSENINLSVGNINFNRYSQIFIGGHLLMIDSVINNNGLISVAGSIIFSGNSTIIGNGILI